MGKFSGWRVEYDSHPLAAVTANYIDIIEAELAGECDYLSVLIWIDHIALAINKYCDNNLIKGDTAAEYWLELFLYRVDIVCKWDCLQ